MPVCITGSCKVKTEDFRGKKEKQIGIEKRWKQWTRSREMKDESWSVVKGMGSSEPPFPRQGVEMLLLPRGPNAVVGCSHPDLWLGLGGSTMGPKFVYLL